MQIKISSPKPTCPYCGLSWYITEEKVSNGRVLCSCRCGYSWIKENWSEMMLRTGKYWDGTRWASDYLEEQLTDRGRVA